MQRRALLSATAGILSAVFLAGCGQRLPASQNETPGSTTTETTTADPTSSTTESTTSSTIDTPQSLAIDETATVAGGSVRVSTVTAQRSVYALSTAHHTAPIMPPDSQFLIAGFQTTLEDGHGAAREHTHLELDGERYTLADQDLPPAGGGFQLAYTVPLSTKPTTGRLVWEVEGTDVAYWRLPETVLDAIRMPPEFAVTAVDVPETVAVTERIPVSVTVENTGSGPGTFRAQLGVEGVYSELPRFEQSLEAGAQATRTEDLRHDTPARESATVVLDWGADRIERQVEVE